jgi:hypothetical protein
LMVIYIKIYHKCTMHRCIVKLRTSVVT